jgi:EpsD family peptidyl-prolyl cis-trans isomerase
MVFFKCIAIQSFLLMLTLTSSSLIWAQSYKSTSPLPLVANTSVSAISNPAPLSSNSPAVATVNGQSISTVQLNAASARLLVGVSDPAVQLRIKNQVLNDLINQTLIMQAITKNQIVLSEDDQLQIDNLYQQAVLNFYLAKQAGAAPKPNNQAIDDYIRKNPNVFEKRKTYHFTQILIESNDVKRFETIEALVQKGATLNDLTTWLTQEKVPYSRNNVWRSTEQINPATVTTLDSLKINAIDLQLTPDQKLIQVLQLQGAYADPVNIEDARSEILRGIAKDASSKAAKVAMDHLRAKAEIQIRDSALTQSLQAAPLESNAYIAPISMLSKIAVLWWFSLLVLVPACAITLYRQITPAKPAY